MREPVLAWRPLLRLRRRTLQFLFRLRQLSRLDDKTWFVVLVVGVGVGAALVSRVLGLAASGVQVLALGHGEDLLSLVRDLPPLWCVAVPALGGLAFTLIVRLAPRRTVGEGLPEIMEAVSLKGSGTLRLSAVLPRSLASIVLSGAGGSVGREGPLVQAAAAFASALGRAVKMPGHRLRVLVGCGVAAGMAANYNAPVGAAFFAMEVIFGNFALDVFGPLVVASAVATLVSHPTTMDQPLFVLSEAGLRSGWELPAFLLIGAVGAIATQALTRTLTVVESGFQRLRIPAWLRVACGGAGVGALALAIPEVWGNGKPAVDEVLGGALGVRLLLLLFAAKVLATALTLGSGGAGGIFTPALLGGASLGSAAGIGLALLAPALIGAPSGYAAAGMAGALAALTHAPMTGLLIVFDLTRDYGLLLPLMLASVAGAVVAGRLEPRSVYAERLRRRGVDLDMAFEDLALGSLRASDLMRASVPTVDGSETITELLHRFSEVHENQVIVVDGEGKSTGVIDLRDVVDYSGDLAAGQILLACDLARYVAPLTLTAPLSDAMERVWREDSAMLPVVDPARGGKLVGGLARKDLLNAFDREMLRKRLLLTRYLASRGDAGPAEARPSEEYVLIERAVPERLAGKSLADLDLPAGRRVLVVALRRGEGDQARETMPPPADLPLAAGDRLVLLGNRREVDGFDL